ncbi:MAG: PA14 domain protein [Candidatus Levybacteria bacterium GW2011_GWC2_37_7]|nr:MAG: PA14 domain protein [Candidatus Levybacteria bacterium GW2011_GWC2_37_7]
MRRFTACCFAFIIVLIIFGFYPPQQTPVFAFVYDCLNPEYNAGNCTNGNIPVNCGNSDGTTGQDCCRYLAQTYQEQGMNVTASCKDFCGNPSNPGGGACLRDSANQCLNFSADNYCGLAPGGVEPVFCCNYTVAPPTPACNSGISCTGTCTATSSNTCSVGNGTQGSCVYTTYTGGGTCTQATAPNQTCTIPNCNPGNTCVNGVCVPPVVTGCTNDNDCLDSNACTTDICNISAGTCSYPPVPNNPITFWDTPNQYACCNGAKTYSSTCNTTALTITTSAATNKTTTTATLNGNVTSTGGINPTVTVYWGTSNGGQTPGNWTFSSAPTSPSQPQGVAAFSKNVTGLTQGTTYYFSAKATNTSETSWGTTQSFTTSSSGGNPLPPPPGGGGKPTPNFFSIHGSVWVDSIQNGIRDSTEVCYEGKYTISLTGPVSQGPYERYQYAQFGSCRTIDYFSYAFTDLPAGTYTVTVNPIQSYGFTAPISGQQTVVLKL